MSPCAVRLGSHRHRGTFLPHEGGAYPQVIPRSGRDVARALRAALRHRLGFPLPCEQLLSLCLQPLARPLLSRGGVKRRLGQRPAVHLQRCVGPRLRGLCIFDARRLRRRLPSLLPRPQVLTVDLDERLGDGGGHPLGPTHT